MIRYTIKYNYNNSYYIGSSNIGQRFYEKEEFNSNIKYAKKYKSLNSLLRNRIINFHDFNSYFLGFIDAIEKDTIIGRVLKLSKLLKELLYINFWDYLGYKIEVVEIENNKIISTEVLSEFDFYSFLCDKRDYIMKNKKII